MIVLWLLSAGLLLAAASVATLWMPGADREVETVDAAPLAAQAAPAPSINRRQCDECGVITRMRRVEATQAQPAHYVFVVRMRDGSLRESTEPVAGRWQEGDRVILIGSPTDAPAVSPATD